MPQHDYVIDNQGGAAFRADMNAVLMAIVQGNNGPTPPNPSYPFQRWIDTSTTPATIRIRNGANTAWIVEGTADTANLGLVPAAGGGTLNNTPIGQQTPAAVTGTVVKATQGFIATGNVPSSPPSSVILDFNSGNGRLYAQTSSGAYANILMPGGGFQVPGGIDNTPIGQTTQAAGAFTQIGVTGGVWSAPAAGHGLGMGNPGWGLVLAGNGSSYDVVIANKNEVAAIVIPTGTYRVVFNSASDTGDAGVFGGTVSASPGISGNQVVNYSQFSCSKGTSGWEKLPNGMIRQWGTFTTTTTGVTVTFPIAFPTACVSVTPTPVTSGNPWANADILSAQQATIKTWNTAGQIASSGTYEAIGY